MSKRIWKFPLLWDARQSVDLAPTDRVLCVQMQQKRPTLWAVVDRYEFPITCPRTVTIVGTGHEVPDDAGDYVGTFQDGAFVGHVFVSPSTPNQSEQ